ncbi:arrestin, implicated in vesicle-mediated transport, meiosis specific [Schizosaccharomyces osmophilus]|uniref:Arrestin, implicated in vesicle-mediated transport, meiosis specific n=1 Tax=Schizosaccharomyces osmophilus TaxID=2545709 RepID=A0AAF0AVS6_9SCHI|nr:arrestin, implicated in vesicle-mediated transport, meiosis specific [Schizosaccharomyces osmophilus]WBW73891.1 arrestin, implicated in vesicle-mediated transport, meiosis specific [Schizosaccharomyces osmophilus]
MKVIKRDKRFFHKKNETIISCSTVNYAAKEVIYELTSSPKLKSSDVALTFEFDSPIFFQESELKGLIHLAVKPKEQSVDFIRIEVQVLGISQCKQGHPTVFFCTGKSIMDRKYTVPNELAEYAMNTTGDYSIAIQHTQGIPVAFEIDLYGQAGGPGRQSTPHFKVNYYIYANAIYQFGDKVKKVRECQEINVLPKMLSSSFLLSPPLLCVSKPKPKIGFCKQNTANRLTVRLPRSQWLGGESIIAYVKMENYGDYEIKHLNLSLFKRITIFRGPLGKKDQPDALSRVKKRNSIRKEIWICVQKEEIHDKRKSGYCNWQEISTLGTHTMECQIRVPQKEVTINVGSDFQVEYVLQVLVGSKWRTLNCIKMPIQIIPACAPPAGQDASFVDAAIYNSEDESIVLPQNPPSEFHRVSYEPHPTAEHVSTHDYVFFG